MTQREAAIKREILVKLEQLREIEVNDGRPLCALAYEGAAAIVEIEFDKAEE